MKSKASLIIVILIFFIGAGICLYPTVSSYINKMNESHAVDVLDDAVKNTDTKTIEKERQAVIDYNKSLVDNHIILTDPFDPDAFPITDGNYSELLTLSEVMASVEIPKINVNLPVYHGTDEVTLQTGVGHLENTSLPCGGESTHCVLSAHTGLPTAKLFTDIDKLVIGDIFYVTVLGEKLSYMVDSVKVAEPDDASDLMIEKGKDYVTLFTCTPYGQNTHRLLVRGVRVSNEYSKKVEAEKNESLTLSEKVLAKFGISLRELIVYIAIAVFAVIFIIVLIVIFVPKRGRKKREKEKDN